MALPKGAEWNFNFRESRFCSTIQLTRARRLYDNHVQSWPRTRHSAARFLGDGCCSHYSRRSSSRFCATRYLRGSDRSICLGDVSVNRSGITHDVCRRRTVRDTICTQLVRRWSVNVFTWSPKPLIHPWHGSLRTPNLISGSRLLEVNRQVGRGVPGCSDHSVVLCPGAESLSSGPPSGACRS